MKDVWAVFDKGRMDRYRAKYGMDATEKLTRMQLIKAGFDLNHYIEITTNHAGNPNLLLYEQTKEIIETGEALKYHRKQKELLKRRN